MERERCKMVMILRGLNEENQRSPELRNVRRNFGRAITWREGRPLLAGRPAGLCLISVELLHRVGFQPKGEIR